MPGNGYGMRAILCGTCPVRLKNAFRQLLNHGVLLLTDCG